MQITYIIQKSRRRSISVSIMADNKVLVKAPYGTTERTVQEFLVAKICILLQYYYFIIKLIV